MRIVRFITTLLVVAGALNWGLWGFFQYDLVADLYGGASTTWARIIYSVVGLAGIYSIRLLFLGCVYTHSKCICKKEED